MIENLNSAELNNKVIINFIEKYQRLMPKMKLVYLTGEETYPEEFEANFLNCQLLDSKTKEKTKSILVNIKAGTKNINDDTAELVANRLFDQVYTFGMCSLFLEDVQLKDGSVFRHDYPKDIKPIVKAEDPIRQIQEFLAFTKEVYGEDYDTLSLKPETFFNINQKFPTFLDNVSQLNLKVELIFIPRKDYFEDIPSSEVIVGNKLLFTNSQDYYGGLSGYYFGYGQITESVVINLLTEDVDKDIVTVFTDPVRAYYIKDIKTEEIEAWAILRGMPIKVRPTASAVLEFLL